MYFRTFIKQQLAVELGQKLMKVNKSPMGLFCFGNLSFKLSLCNSAKSCWQPLFQTKRNKCGRKLSPTVAAVTGVCGLYTAIATLKLGTIAPPAPLPCPNKLWKKLNEKLATNLRTLADKGSPSVRQKLSQRARVVAAIEIN